MADRLKTFFAFLLTFFCLFSGKIAEASVTDKWMPLPASNNAFLMKHYRYAQMLWAFDYGHALIYEQLWRNAQTGDFDFSFIEGPVEPPQKSVLEQVMGILADPPKQSPMEETLSPLFTKDFNWVMDMFAWSHKLHWVSADVISAEPLGRAKAILKQQLTEVYQRYPTLALPVKCKSMMQLMEGQPYSMVFRRSAPAANGLIWAYHYYQLAIYDALMEPAGPKREAALAKVLKVFQKMAEDPANNITEMPMSRQVAPKFTKEFPELAAIFDNLHEFHDVVGDVLSASSQMKLKKEDEIVKIGVPNNIKIPIPGDKEHILVKYDQPEPKRSQMNFTLGLTLDDKTFLIECEKNGHTD